MNAIILCGGLSTRLGETTKTIPKILLEIGDRTVLDWQLQKLKTLGIDTVVLAAGHLADVLQKEVGEERHGMKLVYVIEEKRLGTGGAIKHALNHVPNKGAPTIILNGDVLTSVDLPHKVSQLREDSDGIILGARVEDASSYGTLNYDETGHLKAFEEKKGIVAPAYINGGMYIFTPHMHKYFPEEDTFSIEYDVFPHMEHLYVYESDHPWIDIGVPERLQWAKDNWERFLEE